MRYEGALEWRWTTRSYDDRQLIAAAEVARRNGWYERAIDTAERTSTLHDFTLRFPTPYREVVSSYSRALDLDEAWIYGLVRQESRFVADARSSAGAQGLMQLMPSTARQVARRLGLPGFQRHHVISVDTNINLGTYHLRQLLDDLDNQAVLAAAGYNAGLRRAREWRAPAAAGRRGVRRVHSVHGNPRLRAQSDEQHDVLLASVRATLRQPQAAARNHRPAACGQRVTVRPRLPLWLIAFDADP